MNTTEQEVLDAAACLVRAFGSGDLPSYFATFADDATFVFHTSPQVLDSLDAYRQEWKQWERRDAFRVVSCTSSDQRVQDLGDVAVFTHRVRTRIATRGGHTDLSERETIIFRRDDGGRWTAVHEHLSQDPADDRATP